MRDATLRHLNACDVNYDGIVGWPGLDLENALDCPRVQCIGRQTIYRFGGKRDHFSRTQEFHRPLHRGLEQAGRVGRQNFGHGRWRLFHGRNLPANPAKAHEKSRTP